MRVRDNLPLLNPCPAGFSSHILFGCADGQQLYTVAVAGSSQPIPATADHLAQNFEPGERVLFRPPDHRPPSEASVNQTDLTHWCAAG